MVAGLGRKRTGEIFEKHILKESAIKRFKPDWKEARERMASWWKGEETDRVAASLVAPKKTHISSCREDNRVPEKFIDPKVVFNNLEIRLANTIWGGEAFPVHFVYLGAMFTVTFLGAEPIFYENGAWYKSPYSGWEDADKVNFERENRWWNLYRNLVKTSAENSKGEYFTTVGGIGASIDVFAELFGPEKTLISMVDMPGKVKELRERIIGWGKETYDELSSIISPYQEGSIDWMQMWAPGRVRSLQCDLSVAFSPSMFRDFVMPELRSFWEHVDYGIYHLDGETQKKHVDMLLSLESLDVIQFVPITRNDRIYPRDPMFHIDLFRKILEGGKKVIIVCPVERIKPLLNSIPRKGVYLCCTGCQDEKMVSDTLKILDSIGT